jgi:predicted dehydrogenase
VTRSDLPGYKPVGVGVVGLGYWGPNIVRNLVELGDAHVARVCDTRDSRLDAITSRYPGIVGGKDFDELLADESVEAVALATPVSTHHPLAVAALEAGKHVFVEKPLAASAQEALFLIELADRKGLVLMPGHTFLYSPPVNRVREMIAAEELGEIHFISTSRVNLGLHQPDVSVAWDLAPHDFSILRYWLEETPTHVTALARGYAIPDIPDVAFINLEFGSGTIAHAELSWLAPSKLRRTTIVGSQKMVVYDDTSNEPIRVFDSGVALRDPTTFGEYRLSYRTGDIVSPHVEPAEPLFLELRDFCAAVRTGSTPRSSKELGLDVVRMIESVDVSLANNGGRVEIDEALPITATAFLAAPSPPPTTPTPETRTPPRRLRQRASDLPASATAQVSRRRS